MKPRINVITLGVSDMQKSVDFYKSLDWPVKTQGNIAFFNLDNIIFALYPREKLAEDATVDAQGSGFTGITLAYNAINEEEVDQIFKQVEKIGAKVIKKPQKVFWGGYSGYFSDPDGYLWEVAYNPFWELDSEGNIILPKEKQKNG